MTFCENRIIGRIVYLMFDFIGSLVYLVISLSWQLEFLVICSLTGVGILVLTLGRSTLNIER